MPRPYLLRTISVGWRGGSRQAGLSPSPMATRHYAGPPPFVRRAARSTPPPASLSDSFYDSLHNDLQADQIGRVFPPAFVPRTPAPMKHELDRGAALSWVYPTNLPLRTYQFEIVRKSLFQNALVALPTGLGKTFIAGCVMLNYARWYPTAKIFFLAPTKPLVDQQAKAFPETCGYLNSKIAVLNGSTSAEARAEIYPRKQVFFMTAQTLQNDIANGAFDPRDAVLLVVDEAHRATKNHAYAEVARVIRVQNPNVRILALTATPSSKLSGVQDVIDSLGLTNIELLSEKSNVLQPYLHKKTTTEVQVPLTPQLEGLRDTLADLMRRLMAKPDIRRILPATAADPLTANAYTFNRILLSPRSRGGINASAKNGLMILGAYARAMEYLQLHSIRMSVDTLLAMRSNERRHEDLKREALRMRGTDGSYPAHPKALALRQMLLEYFAPRETDDDRGDFDPDTTRVMVFCSYRRATEEVVSLLKGHGPSLRPVAFVGQATDPSGEKGLTQAQQRAIIADFKTGKYNILVATCIGEEGLDIGSVDRVFCYDVPTSSVRLLQRIGRTGRQRDGVVTVLVGKGRETDAWQRAQDNYARVQHEIKLGDRYNFHAAPRLMPDDIEPVCVREVVPIDSSVPDYLFELAKKEATKAEASQAKLDAAEAMAARKEARAAAAAEKLAVKAAKAAAKAAEVAAKAEAKAAAVKAA